MSALFSTSHTATPAPVYRALFSAARFCRTFVAARFAFRAARFRRSQCGFLLGGNRSGRAGLEIRARVGLRSAAAEHKGGNQGQSESQRASIVHFLGYHKTPGIITLDDSFQRKLYRRNLTTQRADADARRRAAQAGRFCALTGMRIALVETQSCAAQALRDSLGRATTG